MASRDSKRTTHRATGGTKVYAVRGGAGKSKDIQQYERAHRRDVRRTSKAEARLGGAGAGQALERALRAQGVGSCSALG